MRFGIRVVRRCGALAAVAGLAALTACAGFFPSTSSSSSSSNGGSGGAIGGNYVYALNPTANTLSGYAIGSGGTLAQVSGSPYALPTGLTSMNVPGAVVVSGLDTFVYVAGNGSIYGYSLGTNGQLIALNSGTAVASVNCWSLDASPDGNWLACLDNSVGTVGRVDIYQINATTGALTVGAMVSSTATYTGLVVARMIKFSPQANYIVEALGTAGNALFSFNTSTGAVGYLNAFNPTTSSVNYNAVAINKTDTELYMTESGPQTGILDFALTASAGEQGGSTVYPSIANGAQSLVLSSSNGYLYAGNFSGISISEFAFVSGNPAEISGSPMSAPASVYSMARDNSGNYILAGLAGTATDLVMYGQSTTTTGALSSVASAATSSVNDSIGLEIACTH
jgi:6-phosphogluconolactonase